MRGKHPALLLRRGRYADLEIHAMMSVTFYCESLYTFLMCDFHPKTSLRIYFSQFHL